MSKSQTQTILENAIKDIAKLYEICLDAYTHMPIVYEQQNKPNDVTSEDLYIITVPYDSLPEDSILFVLPKYTSRHNTVKLKINFNTGISKTYLVITENNIGQTTNAGSNSLIVNRLAMFRFLKTDSNTIVLTNNPYQSKINASELRVSTKAIFRQMPVYLPPNITNDEDISNGYEFVLKSDYNNLLARVEKLENRLVIGTDDPNDITEDLEEGQIYMQVEEYRHD